MEVERVVAATQRPHSSALDFVVHYLQLICSWPLAQVICEYVLPLSFAATAVPPLLYYALGEHDNSAELVSFMADALGSMMCAIKMLALQKHAVTILAVRKIEEEFTPMERKVATQAVTLNERCEKRCTTLMRCFVYSYGMLSVVAIAGMLQAVIRNDPWLSVKAPTFVLQTRPIYIFTVVTSIVEYSLFPVTVGIFDSLLITLCLHIASKCDVLALMMRKLVCEEAAEDGAAKLRCLRLCAVYHQQIIRLHGAAESIFCTTALCQMVFTLFGLATPLFRILGKTTAVTVHDIAFGALYVAYTFMELFTFCYFGDVVAESSALLSTAIYGTFYPSLSPKDTLVARIQNMILLRTQRPLFLTAGRYTNLTLNLFQDVSHEHLVFP
ncbi:odorant receptor 82a-like isoform X2 [Frankliniella occidentalis]|uniref:Odorant receptor n=1 Tax=Frankliniella occidentalis TaxID=133901 RepID=A0A9C6X6Q7_FRAOC|nr:odorant receptor 82a-like isoform X1 [Frankliniella occidentalis]XP_052130132.1 odorant receptor 82a-like isoform X2 [Frankliniella occidentalis]